MQSRLHLTLELRGLIIVTGMALSGHLGSRGSAAWVRIEFKHQRYIMG